MKSLRPSGFSLVELLITTAILAVLVAIGFPSYQQWVRNSRIRSATESVQNGLRIARSEAAQRGGNVRFEFTNTNTADWTVCALSTSDSSASPTCADAGATTIQQWTAGNGPANVTINASTSTASLATLTSPLSGGVATHTGVTLNNLGRPTGVTPLTRVDITMGQANDRWLVTTIATGGMIRTCDPQLKLSVSAQGCSN